MGKRERLLRGFKEYILLGRIGMRCISPAHAHRGFLHLHIIFVSFPYTKKGSLDRHKEKEEEILKKRITSFWIVLGRSMVEIANNMRQVAFSF